MPSAVSLVITTRHFPFASDSVWQSTQSIANSSPPVGSGFSVLSHVSFLAFPAKTAILALDTVFPDESCTTPPSSIRSVGCRRTTMFNVLSGLISYLIAL